MLLDEKGYAAAFRDGKGALARHTYNHRYDARRFRFVDETCRAIGTLLKEYPDVLLKNYQFALPPFPVTYAEVEFFALLESIGATTTATLRPDGAAKVGYLSADGILTSLCQPRPSVNLDVMPTFHCFALDMAPNPPAHRPNKCSRIEFKDDWGMCVIALGSTFTSGEPTEEIVADIHKRASLWVEDWIAGPTQSALDKLSTPANRAKPEALSFLKEFVGDVRNWWALMLWLNSSGHVVYDVQPRHREMTRRGQVLHQEHTVVRIKPGVTYHNVAKSYYKRSAPGAHNVRPFYRNYNKIDDCIHEFPLYPDENGRWQCKKCPQWRIRVEGHRRGDEERPVKRIGYQA